MHLDTVKLYYKTLDLWLISLPLKYHTFGGGVLRQQFRGKPYAFVDEPRVHISAKFMSTRDLRRTTFCV